MLNNYSMFQIPSALRAVKDCGPPCSFPLKIICLASFKSSRFTEVSGIKPLSLFSESVFAFSSCGCKISILIQKKVLLNPKSLVTNYDVPTHLLHILLEYEIPDTAYLSSVEYLTVLQE